MSDFEYLQETSWTSWAREPRPEGSVRKFHVRAGMQRILESVSAAYDLEIVDIVGERRLKTIVEARGVVYWLARRTGLSYSEIGHQLGRDHTSIMCRVKAVREGTRMLAIAKALAIKLGIAGDVVAAVPRVRIRIEGAA